MHSTGSIPRRWSVADSRDVRCPQVGPVLTFDISESGNLLAYERHCVARGETQVGGKEAGR